MALCRHVRPLALTQLDRTLLEPLPSVQPHNFPTLSLLLASSFPPPPLLPLPLSPPFSPILVILPYYLFFLFLHLNTSL